MQQLLDLRLQGFARGGLARGVLLSLPIPLARLRAWRGRLGAIASSLLPSALLQRRLLAALPAGSLILPPGISLGRSGLVGALPLAALGLPAIGLAGWRRVLRLTALP